MNIKNKNISIYSVAKRAQVSPATVSRVLNQSASVNLETRRRVLTVIEESGFRPRQTRNRIGKVAFVVIKETAVIDFYTSRIMEGVMAFCSEVGFDLSVIYLTVDQSKQETVVKTIMEHSCDVVIVHGSNDEFLDLMRKATMPVIVVGNYYENLNGVYYADLDSTKGTRLAMEYLLGLGHRRIALFCANMSSKEHDDRLETYKKVIIEHDLEFDPSLIVPLIPSDSSMKSGRMMMDAFLEEKRDFSAILGMADELIYGILRSLHDHKIRIPEDISLVGFDDYEVSSYLEPPLTTVSQPLFEIGSYAAKAAMTIINNGNIKHINRTFEPELVIRSSAAALKKH